MTDSVPDAGDDQAALAAAVPAPGVSANALGTSPRALAVQAIDMTKRFPGVVANDHVSFEAAEGEVHALLGENGAGKTTLCNLLMGLYRPDEGKLFVRGKPVRFHSPRDAQDAGIFMVHQHLRLVESMTVAENVVLGWSTPRQLRFSPHKVEKVVADAAERFQMPVDPRARIWQLSLGERQRVEILKALYRGAKILILDEPTTVLTPQEADQLFSSVRDMAAAGQTVIFISHKLPEVLAVADRVTILRQGRSITTVPTAGTDADHLAGLMVGREVSLEVTAKLAEEPGPVVLELEGVSARGDLGAEALKDVSLTVHAGEILGIAGVSGNGQRELAEVITGLRPITHGHVSINGERLPDGDSRAAIDLGVAYVPEDRMGTGISPNLSIAENLILKSYRGKTMRVGPVLSSRKAIANAKVLIERFDVRAPGPRTLIRQLSGGNIQKVLLARELSSDPRVLVAASPTRGLDVGATQYVRHVLTETAKSGVAVVMVSEDLDEVLELSDRIAVFYNGRVVGVVAAADADRQQIGLMMAGAS
ncbi:MAG: ABC transporter ATP-binding protein [Acidimicrobiales bacterium]|jgi:simple sugar transport system ATP-binding protein